MPPDSFSIARRNVDLYVEAHGSGATLVCTHFFGDEVSNDKSLRFADGTKVPFAELATCRLPFAGETALVDEPVMVPA